MRLRKTLRTALRALRRNVTRSALTILGIVIGIAAVIAMMEIGKGSSAAIAKTIASTGANNLLVLPGTASSGGVTFGAGSVLTLTSEDCNAILAECGAVADASPIVRARTQAIYQDRNWVPAYIYGTAPGYLGVRGWSELAEGEPFDETDVRNASRVCMVGQTIVRELFQSQSPVGKEMRIQNVGFRVVGVLTAKGANAFGMDQDDIILAPWTTIKYRVVGGSGVAAAQASASITTNGNALYPGGLSLYPIPSAAQLADRPMPVRFANVDQIIAAARSAPEIRTAIREITDLLRQRHNIRTEDPSDFNIRDMTESANALASTTAMMTNLLLSVALISLVVGGVGIMNIMLVSVTERTREIGLRKALGATRRDILSQFLVEAATLSTSGGVIGLALGVLIAVLIGLLTPLPTFISPLAVMLGLVTATCVGLFFGAYPASRAARQDPIEALRYE
jgi:ABC-type antimicrobial peptide transport system permease subunit